MRFGIRYSFSMLAGLTGQREKRSFEKRSSSERWYTYRAISKFYKHCRGCARTEPSPLTAADTGK